MLSCSISSANSSDVEIVEKGKPAPYTGYLFSPEKAQLTRIRLIEADEAKLLNESYARTIELYRKNEDIHNQKVNILLEQNDKLATQLQKSQSLTQFEKIAWFIGGIVLSGAAVYGASKVVK